MREIVYLNGEFVLQDEAKISPRDRGFIFADGVYEVAKYYNGKPFRYDDHLTRLKRSLAELSIDFNETDGLQAVFQNLLSKNNLEKTHAGVYIQISRGEYKRIHSFPENVKSTVYAYAFELPSSSEDLENGIKVITHEDIRWQRCDIKSVSLLPNTMLFNKAVEAEAGECVLIRNGMVTEATHSSVLGVKNGVVITRPLSNLILPGITRKVILEICVENNIPIEERLFSEKELYELDEIIIAGTGSEVTPAVQVNETVIGNKKSGEITRLIQKEFFKLV
ncbi:MAG: D-amino-acid transaminase [Bacteroidetes bacterium]|nr:D-amino-acid transaminase [Bacteroidota bacterium]